MKINQAMKRTGLSRKAIYVYEDRGLLTPAKGFQGYREYSEDDIRRLLLIAKLRELGLPLEGIARIFQRPEETDILIQRRYEEVQKELQETVHRLSQLQTILYNLPPNGHPQDLARAAEIAVPETEAKAKAKQLSEEVPVSSARRFAMQLYEAFLDMPLDTPERWNAWYDLLDKVERLGKHMWEGFENIYGSMTAQQLCEDYRLRRELVVGYTHYTPQDEERKAAEILEYLTRLTQDGTYCRRWLDYYESVVEPTLWAAVPARDISMILEGLSNVYVPYQNEIRKILDQRIFSYLNSPAGEGLRQKLAEALGDAELDHETLIYFDFWNNTLEKAVNK